MKRRQFFESLTAALLAVLMLVGGFSLAAPPEGKGGGKNKDDGGGDDGGTTDPLPPIKYEITYFHMPADTDVRVRRTFNQMNNDFGDIVGYISDGADRRGYLLRWFIEDTSEGCVLEGKAGVSDDLCLCQWLIQVSKHRCPEQAACGAVTTRSRPREPRRPSRPFVCRFSTGI